MDKAVPTLDTAGWLLEPGAAGARLLAYLFTTYEWQSNEFVDSIVSVPGIIISNINDQQGTINDLKAGIKTVFERHFDIVNIEVSVADKTVSKYTLTINVRYGSSEKMYDLGTELFVDAEKNKLTTFIDALQS